MLGVRCSHCHIRPAQSQEPPRKPTAEFILNSILDYFTATDTEPYEHQEEAILEFFAGNNVILNTPTGSGKSRSSHCLAPPGDTIASAACSSG